MKKGMVVLMIILVILVLGMGGYLAYDKILRKEEVNEEKTEKKQEEVDQEENKKEIGINSDMVKNLVYPITSPNISGYLKGFLLDEVKVSDYTRNDKMVISQFSTEREIDDTYTCRNNSNLYCDKYSAEAIEKSYVSLFGPDDKYENADVQTSGCGFIGKYYLDGNYYEAVNGCGGAYDLTKSLRKTYKAEVKDEYLYIYDYAVIIEDVPSIGKILLFSSYENYKKYSSTKDESNADYYFVYDSEAQSKFEELINNGTTKTYIWTFRKQSDGKYYYYSSKWQD